MKEISSFLGLHQSTTYRVLATLIAYEFVEQNSQNEKYRLGISARVLSDAYMRNKDLWQTAIAHLQTLRDRSGENTHLGILTDSEVVYLDKLSGFQSVGINPSRIGRRAPIHCTALGKSMLVFLPEESLNEKLRNYPLVRYTASTIAELNQLRLELASIRG